MRYGVAARTPPSPWMASPPPPPQWPHGPGPAEELRRVVADLAHHVQSLKQSIDRLNPPVPRVTHDDAAASPAPAPPPAPSLPRSTSAPTLAGLAPHLPPDPAARTRPLTRPLTRPRTRPRTQPRIFPALRRRRRRARPTCSRPASSRAYFYRLLKAAPRCAGLPPESNPAAPRASLSNRALSGTRAISRV